MVDVPAICEGLALGEDGIWYGAGPRDISYPSEANQAYAVIEDHSFWFRHRNDCILAAVKAFPPENGGPFLDLGGGNGFVASALAAAGLDVAVVEPGPAGALNSRQRGLTSVICASTETARFRAGSVNGIGLFDVLEHVADDLTFLTSIRHLLKRKGRLYITVPAHAVLWSHEDVLAGHFRRYSLSSLGAVLTAAGLELEFASYFFRLLPIPIAVLRAVPYRLGMGAPDDTFQRVTRDHVVRRAAISRLIQVVLRSETENVRRRTPMRFGASCLAVATRLNS